MTIAALSYAFQLSAINQLGVDDLLGLVLAGVHEAYPLHLIGDLQLVRGTSVPGQGRAGNTAFWKVLCPRFPDNSCLASP